MAHHSHRILVLDGGMGTTLEAQGYDVSSQLWGLEVVFKNPSILSEIHKKYIAAGADIIETATYQLTLANICDHLRCSEEEARLALHRGLLLAREAVHDEAVKRAVRSGIALSFGPYGSTLQPGQEYGGVYPPPFGPSITSNFFPAASRAEEREQVVQALAQYHLVKLQAFGDLLKQVEWIAFETIPVLHEVYAIRRAMSLLRLELRINQNAESRTWWDDIKYWITSPYPQGFHPQLSESGKHTDAQQVMQALFDDSETSVPDGVGINCTNPSYLATLTKQMTLHLPASINKKPWFVLYPDGGQIYDTTARNWTIAPQSPANAEEWAASVGSLAIEMADAKRDGNYVWEGVIVGGCCKSSFVEITALRKFVDRHCH
ncbi:hypothetical protein L204_102439 [Cryptococcus depauperatus]|nr:hypothetical protein L204_00813 [Cryptococcus depauperatus CBS 7855]